MKNVAGSYGNTLCVCFCVYVSECMCVWCAFFFIISFSFLQNPQTFLKLYHYKILYY